MVPASSQTRQAEERFATFLDRWHRGEGEAPEAFLAAQPPELRPSLERLLADWREVRELLGRRASLLRPGRRLGDFLLIRPLGRGGMGVVWEAEEQSLGRRVALKIMTPAQASSALLQRRFFREAAAGARLAHPGIVQVHALGEDDDLAWIVQELVPGGRTLADRIADLRERVRLPEGHYRQTAALFAAVADALHFAHEQGVLHRDVKPANILLTPDGSPKVGDFGLAHVAGDLGLTRTGQVMGTPYYMSPEQAQARLAEVGRRSDVFSLGATLYEALTLVRPFQGDTSQQVMARIAGHDPVDPRRVRSRVPRDLAVIAMKALEKKPEHRYADMAAMAADLRRWLAAEPILARPPGPLRRAGKWCRRHPVLSGSGAVVSVALAVITALLLQFLAARDDARAAWLREAGQRRSAEDSAAEARREATTTRRVLAFLLGIFEQGDPARSRGEAVTMREVLDRGAERIEADLAEEPAVQARLQDTMGRVYQALGLYEAAESLLTAALDTRRELLGWADVATLDTAGNLANILMRLRRMDEAIALMEESQAARRRLLGPEHVESLRGDSDLAGMYWAAGRLPEAESLLVTALQGLERALGEDHRDTIHVLDNLATIYAAQGRFDEAEPLMERASAGNRAVLGPDHPGTLASLNNLAGLYWAQGRLEEAAAVMGEVLEGRRRVLGASHPATVSAQGNLGLLYKDLGRGAQAEALLVEALATSRRALGDTHPGTLKILSSLGLLYQDLGRYEEASPLLEQCLELRREQQGSDHPDTIHALNNLGVLREAQGYTEEAARLYAEGLERARRVLGEEHPVSQRLFANWQRLQQGGGR